MIKRFIHRIETVELLEANEAELLAAAKALHPRSAVRRMTRLGLLCGLVLDAVGAESTDAMVYASTFGETLALEKFLQSFPTPSPLLFQTSIHPSAVQQVRIAKQQPLVPFFPLANGPDLMTQACKTALLSGPGRTIVVGGEEKGTWLLDAATASDRSFAFAFSLSDNPENALGFLAWKPDAPTGTSGSRSADFFDLLAKRQSGVSGHPETGSVELSWF